MSRRWLVATSSPGSGCTLIKCCCSDLASISSNAHPRYGQRHALVLHTATADVVGVRCVGGCTELWEMCAGPASLSACPLGWLANGCALIPGAMVVYCSSVALHSGS